MGLSRALLGIGLLLTPFAWADSLPEGTDIRVRILSKVSSTATPGEKSEAVVIAPVLVENRLLVPQGSRITINVKSATPAKADARAELTLEFMKLTLPDGSSLPFQAKVAEIDNARESVTDEGMIQGILSSETLAAQMDQGLDKLSAKYSKFGGLLSAIKGAVFEKADTEIVLEPGVELQLSLTQPLEVKGDHPIEHVEPVEPAEELARLVNSLAFQTTAANGKPSDLTNIMYLGSREQIESAFKGAGWTSAAELNATSGLETIRAVAEQRGYKEAPMSTLFLEKRPPDLVFEKQYDTFAKRHHLRIFARPETFQGREVWVCAATHDIGIELSPENRTFIHKIDSEIDHERAKVVFDLMFAGNVGAVALVERPKVPTSSENATGDKISTDGKMVVLQLR